MKSITALALVLSTACADADTPKLRGLTETAATKATSKATFHLKKDDVVTASSAKIANATPRMSDAKKAKAAESLKVKAADSLKVKAAPKLSGVIEYPGSQEKGYLLEFTRVNTDCSGNVMSVAGILTGAVTVFNTNFLGPLKLNVNPPAVTGTAAPAPTDASVAPAPTDASARKLQGPPPFPFTVYYHVYTPDVVKGEGYEYGVGLYKDADGTFQVDGAGFGGPQCSHTPDGYGEGPGGLIPFSYGGFFDHGGYFYGHKYAKGSFKEAVSSEYSAAYELHYDTLNSCQLGVQPTSFFATLIKGQCYFNPNDYLDLDGVKEHSWLKVIGYDKEDQELIYSIHNNDECADLDPFKKAKIERATWAVGGENADYVAIDGDCFLHEFKGWTRYTIF